MKIIKNTNPPLVYPHNPFSGPLTVQFTAEEALAFRILLSKIYVGNSLPRFSAMFSAMASVVPTDKFMRISSSTSVVDEDIREFNQVIANIEKTVDINTGKE